MGAGETVSEAQAHKITELRRAYDVFRKTLQVDVLEEERRALEEKMGEPGFCRDHIPQMWAATHHAVHKPRHLAKVGGGLAVFRQR